MIAIFLASSITSVFLQLNPIRDVHKVRGHKFELLYVGIMHSTNDGLMNIGFQGTIYPPHDHHHK